MFRKELSLLFSGIEEKYPILDEKEKEAIHNKVGYILKEGIRKIPNGGFHGHGRIIITKVVNSETSFKSEILKITENIRFPCNIAVDGHGFLQQNEDVIFVFASPNTSLKFGTDKQSFMLSDNENSIKFDENLEKMTNAKFTEDWFLQHDIVSDYRGSGFQVRRITNLVVFLDPLYTDANKLLQ